MVDPGVMLKATQRVNLSVLHRYDSSITDIIDTAGHVAIYEFLEETQSWKKKEFEGSLFLFKRARTPQYGLFVINRVNTENFTELITANMALQVQQNYLIYKSSRGEIIGIWFYVDDERTRFSSAMTKLIGEEKMKGSAEPSSDLYASTKEKPKSVHPVLQMLRSPPSKSSMDSKLNENNKLTELLQRIELKERTKASSVDSLDKLIVSFLPQNISSVVAFKSQLIAELSSNDQLVHQLYKLYKNEK